MENKYEETEDAIRFALAGSLIDKEDIHKFKNIIERFRLFDSEIQAQTILTIINVFLNQNRFNGYSGTDLADDLGLSQASASRNVMLWSKLTRKKEVGPDYLVATECPVNRSRKRISLSKKGLRYLGKIFPNQ